MLHICIRYHVGCDIDFPAFHGHNLGSRLVLCITDFLFFTNSLLSYILYQYQCTYMILMCADRWKVILLQHSLYFAYTLSDNNHNIIDKNLLIFQ